MLASLHRCGLRGVVRLGGSHTSYPLQLRHQRRLSRQLHLHQRPAGRTTEEYYQEAATIAQSVPAEVDQTKVEWMPLGVFAIAEQDATDTGMLIQLAVSKDGVIAGTFHNDTADVSRPVEGMVDQKTQRAVWRFADGQNPDVVMETSVYNLTEDDTTALVHFGPDKTETWSMIRLPAPEEGGKQ